MSLHRVLQRIQRERAYHESGTRDGYQPIANAHREFLRMAEEDAASVERAISAERRLAALERVAAASRAERSARMAWQSYVDGGPVAQSIAVVDAVSALDVALTELDKIGGGQ